MSNDDDAGSGGGRNRGHLRLIYDRDAAQDGEDTAAGPPSEELLQEVMEEFLDVIASSERIWAYAHQAAEWHLARWRNRIQEGVALLEDGGWTQEQIKEMQGDVQEKRIAFIGLWSSSTWSSTASHTARYCARRLGTVLTYTASTLAKDVMRREQRSLQI